MALTTGRYNVTIEYHNGIGGGALILKSGYNNVTSNMQVSACCFAVKPLGNVCASIAGCSLNTVLTMLNTALSECLHMLTLTL